MPTIADVDNDADNQREAGLIPKLRQTFRVSNLLVSPPNWEVRAEESAPGVRPSTSPTVITICGLVVLSLECEMLFPVEFYGQGGKKDNGAYIWDLICSNIHQSDSIS